MNTGLRVDECMGLDWGDIQFCERNNITEKKRDYYDDIESHYLKIRVVNSKTGEREGYGLGGGYFGLQNLLKLYKKNDIKVKGNIWLNQKSFKEGLNNLLNESGLKYEKKGDTKLTRDSKSFRHSFIQIMLDKGISSTLIAKMLGTSTMMIDKNYTANMRIDSLIEQMNKIDRENKLQNSKLKLVKR
jgi:integrase